MFATIDQAKFIYENGDFLFNSLLLVVLLGFLYGYTTSFIIGIQRSLKLSIFFVISVCTIVMLFTIGFLLSRNCEELLNGSSCGDFTAIATAFSTWIFQLMAHYITNIGAGYIGVGLGLAFRFPTEWIMQKYFNSSFQIGHAVEQEREKIYQTINRPPTERANSSSFIKTSAFKLGLPSNKTDDEKGKSKFQFYKPKQDFQVKKEQWAPLSKPR